MIHIYCRSRHKHKEILCADCLELENYAHERLERCPFGEDKPSCKKCTVHCYKPAYKETVKEVMRFSGPRMLFYRPVAAIRHLWKNNKS